MPSYKLADYLKRTPRAVLNKDIRSAQEYIRQQARELDQSIRRGPGGRFGQVYEDISQLQVGNMYLFVYDAKTKDKLPYWDMHPLIFPFDTNRSGFLGLNMHYLPVNYRVVLMDALLDFASDNPLNEQSNLNLQYGILKNISKYRYYKPCVHKYLNGYVQSRFLLIPATKWINGLLMPTQAFVGPRAGEVYDDSIKKISGVVTQPIGNPPIPPIGHKRKP